MPGAAFRGPGIPKHLFFLCTSYCHLDLDVVPGGSFFADCRVTLVVNHTRNTATNVPASAPCKIRRKLDTPIHRKVNTLFRSKLDTHSGVG